MSQPPADRPAWSRVDVLLIIFVILRLLPLVITNGQSGWHRDELEILDNARHLDWGYVSYPPLAPLIARLALTVFGLSIPGVRLFSSLAMAASILIAARMVHGMGGGGWARAVAGAAVLIMPISMLGGVLFSYSPFDSMWWMVIAFFVMRLLESDDPRWWVGIGAAIGLAMLTKFTAAYLVAGIVLGVLLTPARRHLRSPWLWAGAALAIALVLPNLLWQARHDFITWDFTQFIHARDVRIGRTEGYLLEQFVFSTNPVTIPLWIAGLAFYFFHPRGKPYRLLGWMFVIPFVLFLVSQGRSYYIAPAYPILFAGGAVLAEPAFTALSGVRKRLTHGVMWAAVAAGGLFFAPIAYSIAPVNSAMWQTVSEINEELKEMIGWPELVETVAGIYHALPSDQQAHTGILTGNYGEAGAINLLGPAYGLPTAISGVNTYWLRGYGDPAPQQVIVLGYTASEASLAFESCTRVGKNANAFGVMNEEAREHPNILLCGAPRVPWPELWPHLRRFG